MTLDDIERLVVQAFVVPPRRDRFLKGLVSPKRRAKVLARLDHHVEDIEVRWRIPIMPHQQHASDIGALLRSKGAPEICYVMSTWGQLDRRELPLQLALEEVVGSGMGTLLSCVPGVLGFYESEERGCRFILQRKND